jgi:hypothetical protein
MFIFKQILLIFFNSKDIKERNMKANTYTQMHFSSPGCCHGYLVRIPHQYGLVSWRNQVLYFYLSYPTLDQVGSWKKTVRKAGKNLFSLSPQKWQCKVYIGRLANYSKRNNIAPIFTISL